jgi:hypothetical protein
MAEIHQRGARLTIGGAHFDRSTPSAMRAACNQCAGPHRGGVIVSYPKWHLNAGGIFGALGDARSSGHAVLIALCDQTGRYCSRGHGYNRPAGIGTRGMDTTQHQRTRMYLRPVADTRWDAFIAYMIDTGGRPDYSMFAAFVPNRFSSNPRGSENCTTFTERGLRIAGLSNAVTGAGTSFGSPYAYTFRFLPPRWEMHWTDRYRV